MTTYAIGRSSMGARCIIFLLLLLALGSAEAATTPCDCVSRFLQNPAKLDAECQDMLKKEPLESLADALSGGATFEATDSAVRAALAAKTLACSPDEIGRIKAQLKDLRQKQEQAAGSQLSAVIDKKIAGGVQREDALATNMHRLSVLVAISMFCTMVLILWNIVGAILGPKPAFLRPSGGKIATPLPAERNEEIKTPVERSKAIEEPIRPEATQKRRAVEIKPPQEQPPQPSGTGAADLLPSGNPGRGDLLAAGGPLLDTKVNSKSPEPIETADPVVTAYNAAVRSRRSIEYFQFESTQNGLCFTLMNARERAQNRDLAPAFRTSDTGPYYAVSNRDATYSVFPRLGKHPWGLRRDAAMDYVFRFPDLPEEPDLIVATPANFVRAGDEWTMSSPGELEGL